MIKDIAITSLETITAYDLLSGAQLFILDELQNVSITNAEEKTEITGKAGRKLNSLKRNKAVTISGTNGLLSGGLLELQAGNAFEHKASTVKWSETLAVSNGSTATTFKAVGTAGNEISALYIKNANGTQGELLTQGAQAAKGIFAYNPESKAITFNSGDVADGAEVIVYYTRKVNGDVMVNLSDSYSGKAALYIDALAEDICANVYRVQIHIPKADFSGNFDIALGDSQTVHSFDAESLAGACGAGGALWTWTVFSNDATDAA